MSIVRLPLAFVLLLAMPPEVWSQTPPTPAPAASAPAAADALGRDTPRGTVRGFLAAARKGDDRLARHYLNTRLGEPAAEALARQLFFVLDARLPAQLMKISDQPDGSRSDPLEPDKELIGTIDGVDGPIDVLVERVRPARSAPVWLFSTRTLDAIPATYEQLAKTDAPAFVPAFLVRTQVAGIRLTEWAALLFGLPVLYLLTGLLSRVISLLAAHVGKRFFGGDGILRNALPAPARLLMLALAGRWWIGRIPLSLMVRQMLTNAAGVIAIAALVWLLIVLIHIIGRYAERRIPPANFSATVSLVRVGRALADVVVLLAGVLGMLRHFGVDPTPLLAGLGVGGIAVALAAQKTLENVIAGASLIFDQAVRVGDFLRVGTLEGTVEEIGLRSTRIRTLDRTLVSVPNSQIASASVETLSVRDKFWFHPVVGLVYETTADQILGVLEGIRQVLVRHTTVDGDSVRVRFVRLGASSKDVEVVAYVYARDWPHFLAIQEELLLAITGVIDRAGTEIAFPSQKLYVSTPAPAPMKGV